MLLQMALFHSFLWLSNIPVCKCVCVCVCVCVCTTSYFQGRASFTCAAVLKTQMTKRGLENSF